MEIREADVAARCRRCSGAFGAFGAFVSTMKCPSCGGELEAMAGVTALCLRESPTIKKD